MKPNTIFSGLALKTGDSGAKIILLGALIQFLWTIIRFFGVINGYDYIMGFFITTIHWIGLFIIYCKICSISFHADAPAQNEGITTTQSY